MFVEVVAPLLDLISVKEGYWDVAEYLLSDVVVVPDLKSGLALWNRNGYYSTLVTPDGERTMMVTRQWVSSHETVNHRIGEYVRGDVHTVARHLDALSAHLSHLIPVYAALGVETAADDHRARHPAVLAEPEPWVLVDNLGDPRFRGFIWPSAEHDGCFNIAGAAEDASCTSHIVIPSSARNAITAIITTCFLSFTNSPVNIMITPNNVAAIIAFIFQYRDSVSHAPP